jgi:hypothetical protein
LAAIRRGKQDIRMILLVQKQAPRIEGWTGFRTRIDNQLSIDVLLDAVR